jgi:ABC-2 type transport system permease protein
MVQKYSQVKAMLALTRASLISTFRSPQSTFFSFVIPIVLIWIFGSLGGNGAVSVDVALEKTADTTNAFYLALEHNPGLHFIDQRKTDIEDQLTKGRIAAIIDIKPNADSTKHSKYEVHLRTSSASQRNFQQVYSAIKATVSEMDRQVFPENKSIAVITQSTIQGTEYKNIDFILPGMIGFSLIGAAVFGIAFLFYSLRDTLVLKRIYSTPIKREYIILGESFSKVIFNMIAVVTLIVFGHFVYGFYLAHGWFTFFDILILSFLALLVFMGFGFFISAIAKNQNIIPIYANLFMFPQYFLSGTFFPKSLLPHFLQPVIQALPLTALNDALRNVAFEGASLSSCWLQIIILVVWGIVIYALTAKVFRWE